MHPLEGPFERIRWASERFIELKREMEEFKRETRYDVRIAEPLEGNEYFALRISANRIPPLKWGVIIGDIAHNLRAALDNLVWQLILANSVDPTTLPRPLPEFPIFADEQLFDRDGLPRIHGRVSQRDETTIRRAQPFNYGPRENSVLWTLHELNNADKHRVIQLASPRAGSTNQRITLRGYMFGNRPPDGLSFAEVNEMTSFEQGQFLAHGEQFGSVHRRVVELWPDVRYLPLVTDLSFWKGCDILTGREVVTALDLMGQHVASIVLGRFRDSFPPYPDEWNNQKFS